MVPMRARLLSHFGRQAWVLDGQGQALACVYKGRELQPTANDWVEVDTTAQPAVITEILERRNAVMRSEAHRAKTLAANVDQALIVISGAPLFSDELLARMLCACAVEGITGTVVLNKMDLVDQTKRAQAQLAAFGPALELLGWQVMQIAAKPAGPECNPHDAPAGLEPLNRFLQGKTTLIMGQSGMGKSSVLNALVPGLNAQTREISEALQTGKHTTTAGLVVAQNATTWLIDTPGFQLFGLHHLSESQLALGFPEWRAIHEQHGRCRFANCTHMAEPGCSVRTACENAGHENNQAALRRLDLWRTLRASL